MTHRAKRWRDRLVLSADAREALAAHPWLRPIAERLLDPKLWRFQHESVARGVAVGTFWAFAIPVAQIAAAAAHCTWWRGNIPAAAAMTMVTNPLTVGFWLWLAYQTGSIFTDGPAMSPDPLGSGALSLLAEFGWPTVLGMATFAIGGAIVGYFGVKVLWRLHVMVRRRTRRQSMA